MQLALAIALTSLYVSLSLTLGGVHPRTGIPWWFFAPATVAFLAFFAAEKISASLPIPWDKAPHFDPPPRRIRLSWRTAVRVPAYAPVFIVPCHILWILLQNFAIGWIIGSIALLTLFALAIGALRRRREIKLLRYGATAMGIIEGRSDIDEGTNRITYHFMTSSGMTIQGHGWDIGHNVPEGSSVPVFYNAGKPAEHVIACACWFETD